MAEESALMEESSVPTVSFLGPSSSYSHQVYTLVQHATPAWAYGLTDYDLAQAALQAFEGDRYDYKPAITISDVFDNVQTGNSSLGVVPFENSTNGAVIFTLDLLADRQKQIPDVMICGEAYLEVSHYLLGHKRPNTIVKDMDDSPEASGTCTPTSDVPAPVQPRTTPLYSLKHINRIYTHPQAFGQCEVFLNTYLKGVERVDVTSTSKAAEIVKEDITGRSAAIASVIAADIQDLDILARSIEDRQDNKTRFFVISKGTGLIPKTTTKNSKSLITFTVDHGQAGALAEVLDCFRKEGINLTSIYSRPTRVVPFQYIFFLEFEGSRFVDKGGNVKRALSAIEGFVQNWRWWGSWDDKLVT